MTREDRLKPDGRKSIEMLDNALMDFSDLLRIANDFEILAGSTTGLSSQLWPKVCQMYKVIYDGQNALNTVRAIAKNKNQEE